MSKDVAGPDGSALSAGLGPLPEPAAWNVYWRGDNDGPSWDQWHDASDPLPAAWEGTPPDEVIPHYTAEQMRAYGAQERAAERKRLALLAENRADGWHSLTADEIRRGAL